MYKIAIVGSGPGGLSAAGRAAETGVSHVLLEAKKHLSNTIFSYQKGKHVMAEPGILPLRSPLEFDAGKREYILDAWNKRAEELKINTQYDAEVTAVSGEKGHFTIELKNGETVEAENVVLGIGMQGNLRKIGRPGEDLPFVQYQLNDPEEYFDETIIVIGAGDAAIENALALTTQNKVYIVNRSSEFARIKQGNLDAINTAIENGVLECCYESSVDVIDETPDTDKPGLLVLNTKDSQVKIPCDRVIARIGAIPPRRFIESCGIEFPSDAMMAIPAVSDQYESNVKGMYIVGALAGYPLIKQAMNQGQDIIDYIEGLEVEPPDQKLLEACFTSSPYANVNETLNAIKENVPVLSGLTSLQLREFMLESSLRHPKKGDMVVEKGSSTDTFFSIVEGVVNVQINPNDPSIVIPLKKGMFFGEMSLLSGRKRGATIIAGDDCLLVETPRRSMVKLISSVESVKRVIDNVFLLRAIQGQLATGIAANELTEVVEASSIESYTIGDLIYSAGDSGDCLHLVRSGSVSVSLSDDDGEEKVVTYYTGGTYFGEMSIFSDALRVATIRATVATETIKVAAEPFKRLLKKFPDLRERLESEFHKRALDQDASIHDSNGSGSIITFLLDQGLGEGTDVLVIDDALCIRCDNCERACADTHQNTSRLNREKGPTFSNLHLPTACRHCEQPHCMKECPADAIHRSGNGEVYIADNCIGCGNCERNCPYGAINMAVKDEKKPSLLSWLFFNKSYEPGTYKPSTKGDVIKKAVKCDLCRDLGSGPACVRACPTGAALRVNPEEYIGLF